jgi:serine/threonine-protein kinase
MPMRQDNTEEHPSELVPGTRVGDFRLVRYVAEGGYGCVWLAESAERPGRLYAVKFARRADGRARREVRLHLQIEHPNVTRVVAHGRWRDPDEGWPYLVTEWVEGGTLLEWARRANPPLRVVVDVFGKLTQALQAAHEKGVLHRDVKPTNVLMREADSEPFLGDFGAGDASYATTLTRDGALPPGSLPYRSPEALLFKGEGAFRYGPADDWYALGVSFYEVLTEVAPFPLDVPQEHFIQEAVQRRPVHPSVLNARVPRALGDVVMRLLEKQPGRRFRDGLALHSALQRAREEAAEWEGPLYAPAPQLPPEAAVTRPPTPGDGPAAEDDAVRQAHALKAWVGEDDARLNAALAKRDALLPAQPTRASLARRRRAASVVALVALALLCAAVWAQRRAPPPPPAPPVAVVPPEPVPEPVVPPPPVPASIASEPTSPAPPSAMPRKRDDNVKTKKPSAKTPEKSASDFLQQCARLGLGSAAAMALGCPAVPIHPPPEDCPSGALEAMRQLGIRVGDLASVKLDPAGPRTSDPHVLREGPIVSLVQSGALKGARLYGRVWFGGGERFYIRYIEAQPTGSQPIPICALGQETDKPGWPKEPGSTAESIRVAGNSGWVRFVGKLTEQP